MCQRKSARMKQRLTADAKCLLFCHYKPVRERYAFLVGLVALRCRGSDVLSFAHPLTANRAYPIIFIPLKSAGTADDRDRRAVIVVAAHRFGSRSKIQTRQR
jgi:hypothetical protein